MSRCSLTPAARADLQQIHDYIAKDNPAAALRFVDQLEAHCTRLADHPHSGVARPEFGPAHRSLVVPGTRYVIIYRHANDRVEILHVRHGSPDLVRLFSAGQ